MHPSHLSDTAIQVVLELKVKCKRHGDEVLIHKYWSVQSERTAAKDYRYSTKLIDALNFSRCSDDLSDFSDFSLSRFSTAVFS